MSRFFMVVILFGTVGLTVAEEGQAPLTDKAEFKPDRKYLCSTQSTSAGMEYKEAQGSWMPTIFTANDRYVVSINKRPEDNQLFTTVRLYDDNVAYWFCGEKVASGAMLCSGESSLFVFNEETLRFIDTFFDGYVDGVDGGLNKPYIVVGTCAKM